LIVEQMKMQPNVRESMMLATQDKHLSLPITFVDAHMAKIWRWYTAVVEERRIACHPTADGWIINIDGYNLANNPSFAEAIESAYVMTRALQALEAATP
jgi:hypothetical protein